MSWKSCSLGEIASIQTGPFGSQLHSSDYVAQGIPLVMPVNIGRNLEIIENGIAHISYYDAERLKRHALVSGDIIYSRRGDVEKCAFIKEKQSGWICGTGCLAVRFFSGSVYPQFLAYQFLTESIKGWILGHAVGTTMPNLNSNILSNLPVVLPPLSEQKAIADILGSLDGKIDLLQRQNATLEAMAETLFRQWFIEEAQEDWEEFSLDCIADNIKEQAIPVSLDCNTPYVGLEHIDKKNISLNRVGVSSDISSNKFYFSKYDILFGKLRPYFHKVCFAPFNGVCSTDILVIRPKQKEMLPFCLFAFFQKDLIDFSDYASSGTRMPRTSWNILSQYKMKRPPYDKIKKFNIICQKYIDKIEKNQQQIRTLGKLRDTLLPKLMSGEVRVRVDG